MLQGMFVFFVLGMVLLVCATIKAARQSHRHPALLVSGAVADVGLAMLALWAPHTLQTPVAVVVFLLFQFCARALAFAAWRCIPTMSYGRALCALGFMAAVGGSPFLVPEGRFIITQLLSLSGTLGLAAALAAACSTTVFIWLHLGAVRTLFLELPQESPQGAPCPSSPMLAAKGASVWAHVRVCGLALAVALMGIFRVPFQERVALFLDIPLSLTAHASVFHDPLFLLLYAGAGITAVLALIRPSWTLKGMTLFLAMAFVSLATQADFAAVELLTPHAYFFALMVTGMGFVVGVYSLGYMGRDAHKRSYAIFLLLTFAALVGIVTTTDLTSFYGYWELMTFASWFLVVHDRHKYACHKQGGHAADAILRAGRKYYVMCAGGALFMLPGLCVLGGGHTAVFAISHTVGSMSPVLLGTAALLTLLGFAAKAGIVPLHSWLPDAHPAAPSSVSAPLSGIITKMGIFGIVAFLLPYWDVGSMPHTGFVVSFLGAATLIYGEWMALRQDDIKRLLAYSTLGQVGEICLVLGLGTWLATTGALVHVFNHAIMKDLLFLGAGVCIMRTGSRKLEDLRGLGAHMPWTVTCMAVGLIAIMGLPPFAGFFGKYLMVQALIEQGQVFMACLLLIGSLVGAVYYVRILRLLVFEKRTNLTPLAPIKTQYALYMHLALCFLAALTILIGLLPQYVIHLAAAVADQFFSMTLVAEVTMDIVNISWPVYVWIPFVGALMPVLFKENPKGAAFATATVLLLTAALVLLLGQDLDALSFAFALMVPLMGALNMVYAAGYMAHSHSQWRFYAIFLCMCGGLIGMAAAKNLLTFFVFWEIMSSWTLYMTLAHEGTKGSVREAFKYFLFNLVGATCLFIGVCVVGGSLPLSFVGDYHTWQPLVAQLDRVTVGFAYVLLVVGFVMKAAQLPFRIDWQMHPSLAPTPISGFISSVLLKSAIIGLVKLFVPLGGSLVLFGAIPAGFARALQDIVMWVGGITLLWAAVQALRATNLKLIFIYSTVSQIGYMVLAVGMGTALGYAGSLLHVANHMFFKDALFLVCGVVMLYSHKEDLRDLGGIGRKMPFTMTVFAIAGLSVIGVPPSNGFSSKWLIYHALMESGETALALMSLLGSVITMAYILKFLHAVFLGQPSDYAAASPTPPEATYELSRSMRIPMTILALGCVLTGVFPGIFLMPINTILLEYGLTPLDVSLYGIETGVGAWNATVLAVMVFVAVGGMWWLLNVCVTRNSRQTDVHMCGLLPQEGSRRMPPRALYGGMPTRADVCRGLQGMYTALQRYYAQLNTRRARFMKEKSHD